MESQRAFLRRIGLFGCSNPGLHLLGLPVFQRAMTTHLSDCPPLGPRFIVAEDAQSVGQLAVALIEEEVRSHPEMLLCAAAGSSPARTYQLLGERAARDPDAFRRLRVIQVDEWGGLPASDPATCARDLRKRLLGPAGITPDRYQGFRSDAPDREAECGRVARWLQEHGPIDLCLLGVGINGHVALNEPGQALRPGVHVARLAPGSLHHPMLAVSKRRPTHGLTLGIGDILRSRRILLLATGEHKRTILARLKEPRVTPRFPVSFLWLHPAVTVLCDRVAAGDAAHLNP
jgi:galactosamine-6-phosphate isomerase